MTTPDRPTEGSAPERAPARRAVCLRHERHEGAAPRVVAKGQGLVAERILELAREHGLPVREDPELLELLAACDLGDTIAPDLFGAVAELLAFLYRVQRERALDGAEEPSRPERDSPAGPVGDLQHETG